MSNYFLKYKLDDDSWSNSCACFSWVPSRIAQLNRSKRLSVNFINWALTNNDRFFIDELVRVFGAPVEANITNDALLIISLDLTKFPKSFRNYYAVLGAARLVCEDRPLNFSDNFRYFRESQNLGFFQSMLAAHEFILRDLGCVSLPVGHEYFNSELLVKGKYHILEFKDDKKLVKRFYTEDLGGPYTPLSCKVWPAMGQRKNPFKQQHISNYTSKLQMT